MDRRRESVLANASLRVHPFIRGAIGETSPIPRRPVSDDSIRITRATATTRAPAPPPAAASEPWRPLLPSAQASSSRQQQQSQHPSPTTVPVPPPPKPSVPDARLPRYGVTHPPSSLSRQTAPPQPPKAAPVTPAAATLARVSSPPPMGSVPSSSSNPVASAAAVAAVAGPSSTSTTNRRRAPPPPIHRSTSGDGGVSSQRPTVGNAKTVKVVEPPKPPTATTMHHPSGEPNQQSRAMGIVRKLSFRSRDGRPKDRLASSAAVPARRSMDETRASARPSTEEQRRWAGRGSIDVVRSSDHVETLSSPPQALVRSMEAPPPLTTAPTPHSATATTTTAAVPALAAPTAAKDKRSVVRTSKLVRTSSLGATSRSVFPRRRQQTVPADPMPQQPQLSAAAAYAAAMQTLPGRSNTTSGGKGKAAGKNALGLSAVRETSPRGVSDDETTRAAKARTVVDPHAMPKVPPLKAVPFSQPIAPIKLDGLDENAARKAAPLTSDSDSSAQQRRKPRSRNAETRRLSAGSSRRQEREMRAKLKALSATMTATPVPVSHSASLVPTTAAPAAALVTAQRVPSTPPVPVQELLQPPSSAQLLAPPGSSSASPISAASAIDDDDASSFVGPIHPSDPLYHPQPRRLLSKKSTDNFYLHANVTISAFRGRYSQSPPPPMPSIPHHLPPSPQLPSQFSPQQTPEPAPAFPLADRGHLQLPHRDHRGSVPSVPESVCSDRRQSDMSLAEDVEKPEEEPVDVRASIATSIAQPIPVPPSPVVEAVAELDAAVVGAPEPLPSQIESLIDSPQKNAHTSWSPPAPKAVELPPCPPSAWSPPAPSGADGNSSHSWSPSTAMTKEVDSVTSGRRAAAWSSADSLPQPASGLQSPEPRSPASTEDPTGMTSWTYKQLQQASTYKQLHSSTYQQLHQASPLYKMSFKPQSEPPIEKQARSVSDPKSPEPARVISPASADTVKPPGAWQAEDRVVVARASVPDLSHVQGAASPTLSGEAYTQTSTTPRRGITLDFAQVGTPTAKAHLPSPLVTPANSPSPPTQQHLQSPVDHPSPMSSAGSSSSALRTLTGGGNKPPSSPKSAAARGQARPAVTMATRVRRRSRPPTLPPKSALRQQVAQALAERERNTATLTKDANRESQVSQADSDSVYAGIVSHYTTQGRLPKSRGHSRKLNDPDLEVLSSDEYPKDDDNESVGSDSDSEPEHRSFRQVIGYQQVFLVPTQAQIRHLGAPSRATVHGSATHEHRTTTTQAPVASAAAAAARPHYMSPDAEAEILASLPPSRPLNSVNLTPGAESGRRPRKTGLPQSELHRWLAQSAHA
ncbi:uncharacterized protein LOC62_04G005943 [Vanrija pseudolonga]|uniref:Uncharacterized protein n=1 Tax=Vanrija pseudolonga TaxID=143232 RepID=A0AAF1BMV8_9TREE|nr:hypothetical protein LOC62_04G005943 [Vanrija pseudolonga]